jgi:UDP-N-acetylglucosamine--N-acetylmuramyl-(pentapeptide) pyrophosphoryl-undecaprenol N-acetylglucosamine transferase
MTEPGANTPFVAIACGGTGGHLFPGIAVAEQLTGRGCAVALLISPKEIDQQAVKSTFGMKIITLPAVALQNWNYFSFAGSFVKSFFAAWKVFRRHKPDAVLAMGGFTSASPVWVGKDFGARTFLHESNTIPGRANRLLARFVDEAFVGFPEAAKRLKARKVTATGTPVRAQFFSLENSVGRDSVEPARGDPHPTKIADCRAALGLNPERPTVLVVGGSQGASGINEMILSTLPLLAGKDWQWLHLTGGQDFGKVRAAYAARGLRAVVKSFLLEMDLALGAATVAVSRAGASSLAELAAVRLPSLLVPYPHAADNHQFHNARALETTGAARLLEQKNSAPEKLVTALCELVEDGTTRAAMQTALAQQHAPRAAERIAEIVLQAVARKRETGVVNTRDCGCDCAVGQAKRAH